VSVDPNDVLETAERFSDAIACGDLGGLSQLCAPDFVIWHNTDGSEQTLDENARVSKWLRARVTDLTIQVEHRAAFDDGFVQQQVLRGTTASGAALHVHSCMVVRIGTDGLVARADEYLDSAAIAALSAG